MAPLIPILNIYYLFCYAWSRFPEGEAIVVGGSESPNLPSLLAKVLLNGVRTLQRRGLDRHYQDQEDEIATVRGRIDIGSSLRLRSRNVRRLSCEFDELSYDLLHNQIIKATMKRLAFAEHLDRSLVHELLISARRMSEVSDITLTRQLFSRVQLHRNNAYYQVMMKIAELTFDCLLPDPRGHGFCFNDITKDERRMASVFEDFVRNFYRMKQRQFLIAPLTIKWDGVRVSGRTGRLPTMRADVFLSSRERAIILDTKYYSRALQEYHGTRSFHSDNLYQLFSYLRNAAVMLPELPHVEGMLLYPCTGEALRERFVIQGHSVTIATVDLARPWPEVESQLLLLLEQAPGAASSIPMEKAGDVVQVITAPVD